MAICQQCKAEFPDPVWPQPPQTKYCSPPCNKRACYERHKAKYTTANKAWAAAHPEGRKAIKRRWNNSDKGVKNRATWSRRHRAGMYQALSEETKVLYRQRVQARATSRRTLLQVQPHKQCVIPPPHKGRIECHHKDGNPFNTQVGNLEWRCKSHHVQAHPVTAVARTVRAQIAPVSSPPCTPQDQTE